MLSIRAANMAKEFVELGIGEYEGSEFRNRP